MLAALTKSDPVRVAESMVSPSGMVAIKMMLGSDQSARTQVAIVGILASMAKGNASVPALRNHHLLLPKRPNRDERCNVYVLYREEHWYQVDHTIHCQRKQCDVPNRLVLNQHQKLLKFVILLEKVLQERK